MQVPHSSDGEPVPIQATRLVLPGVSHRYRVQRLHRCLATYVRDPSANQQDRGEALLPTTRQRRIAQVQLRGDEASRQRQ